MRGGRFCQIALLCVIEAASLDLDAVCRKSVEFAKFWGSKALAQGVNSAQCSVDARGLGPDTISLLSADLAELVGDAQCYSNSVDALCALQLTEYNAGTNCRSTKTLFLETIQSCINQQSTSAAAAGVACPGFDVTQNLIIDPVAFCEGASYMKYGAEDPATGLPSSEEKQGFKPGEQADCHEMALAFNTCYTVGVRQLGMVPAFCTSAAEGSFDAYCKSKVDTVKDSTEKSACRNIVFPIIAERLRQSHNSLHTEAVCANLYQKSAAVLGAKAGNARTKAIGAWAGLTSIGRLVDVMNAFKARVAPVVAQNQLFIQAIDDLSSRIVTLNNSAIIPGEYGFTQDIFTKFEEVYTNLNLTYLDAKKVESFDSSDTTVSNAWFAQTEELVQSLLAASESQADVTKTASEFTSQNLTNAATALAPLSMNTVNSYSGEFVTTLDKVGIAIPLTRVEGVKKVASGLGEMIDGYKSRLEERINNFAAPHLQEVENLRSQGRKYQGLTELYTAQWKQLIGFKNEGRTADEVVKTALSKGAAG